MTDGWWIKDPSGLTVLEDSLETPSEQFDTYLTPNDKFFVCNACASPQIDAATYRLLIEGDGIRQPIELTLDDLRAMPQRTVPAFLECAGNNRTLFQKVLGHSLGKSGDVMKTSWSLGGVGMAEWRGVPLRHVLEMAGILDEAFHVCPIGLDDGASEGLIQMPMPASKALDEDTLLALQMNGEDLPGDHGFPVRVIVPGWIGTYSIKWVGKIKVSRKPIWVYRNTEFYVLAGADWPADQYAPARGAPVTEQTIKSSLALPWPAELPNGPCKIHGYARSPSAKIQSVEWSADRGATWNNATINGPNVKYAWVPFSFEWNATHGEHALMTRATDEEGRRQPDQMAFNENSLLFNMVHPHPVVVA